MANLLHEYDSSFNSVVINKLNLSLLGFDGQKHVKDRDNNGFLQESAAEELSDKLNVTEKARLELQNILLVLALEELLCLLGEELIETGTTVLQKGDSEERSLDVFLNG